MRVSKNGLQRSRLSAALLAALLLPATGMVLAQEATEEDTEQAEAEAEDTTELERVVVTGSRIARAEIEGPAPVTIITAEDLEIQGFSTVYDALNTLTQFTGSVQNELTQNGFTPNASFLNLRGLGPGYQLVLINGRRAADYPLPYNSQSNAVNLSNIPAAAIERIEILTGGASAIYGSDAVAGVVNVVMKTDYEGDMLTVRGGTTTRGGGDTGRVQWIGGKMNDGWSLTYAFEALEREEIYASQREFMDSYRDDPSRPPETATAVSGLMLQDGFTGQHIFPDGIEETCGRFSEFETFAFRSATPNRCYYYGYPATQAIRNADRNFSSYLYGTWDFTDEMQGFAQLSATMSEAKLASNTQFWSSGFFFDPTLSSPRLPAGAIVTTQRIFTPDEVGGVGAQNSHYDENAFDAAVGLRGILADGRFDWDATLSHAEYRLDVDRPRFLANELRDYFLGDQMGLDPYFGRYPVHVLDRDRYFNPISAADFQSLNTRVRSDAKSEVTQGNFVLSGDLFELPAGPLAMAAVIEAATQSYEINPDPRTSPDYDGDEPIYNLTSTGGGGDRDRYAVGLELNIPIFSTVTAHVAGRYDKYDDITAVDDAVTWQAGLEWRPFDNLLLRGTHATSFRAPDMHYVFADTSGFFQTVFDEYRCRRDGLDPTGDDCNNNDYVYSVFGTRHGNPELEEETGESTTFGFVWDIRDNMSMSVDYYDIKLEGGVSDINTGYLLRNEADCRLGQERDGTPVDSGSASCGFFTSLIERVGISDIDDDEIDEFQSIPFNQALVQTKGIDASWRYQLDTDRWGDFGFNLAWTHVLELEEQEFPGEPIVNTRDHMQFFNFRSRATGQMSWQRDEWGAALYGYRWGSLPNWAETGRIGSHTIWNVNVSRQITDNAEISLYVNNVLDEIHPKDDTFNSYPFFWRSFSPVGREVFVEFSYLFN
ncbi:MAG TPA: TonB-dependent receptor [Xanthomonadaceae bacterium]|nr:TonB-dependent receptor [Xanthomonadaceae bacterium]